MAEPDKTMPTGRLGQKRSAASCPALPSKKRATCRGSRWPVEMNADGVVARWGNAVVGQASLFLAVVGGGTVHRFLTPLPVLDSSLILIASVMPEGRRDYAVPTQVESDQGLRVSSLDEGHGRLVGPFARTAPHPCKFLRIAMSGRMKMGKAWSRWRDEYGQFQDHLAATVNNPRGLTSQDSADSIGELEIRKAPLFRTWCPTSCHGVASWRTCLRFDAESRYVRRKP